MLLDMRMRLLCVLSTGLLVCGVLVLVVGSSAAMAQATDANLIVNPGLESEIGAELAVIAEELGNTINLAYEGMKIAL